MNLATLKTKLAAMGYTAVDGAPNSITFMFEGGSFYLDVDPKDATYVRLGYPSFWVIEDDRDIAAALTAANKTTESIKVGKAYLIGSTVYASVEQFVENEDAVMTFLPRYLRTLQGVAKAFADQFAKARQHHG